MTEKSLPQTKDENQALSFNGMEIREDKELGMVSLTDIWKAAKGSKNQAPAQWLNLPRAKFFIRDLLNEGTYIHKYNRQYLTLARGRAGTWAHKKVAEEYKRYLKFGRNTKQKEAEIKKELISQLRRKFGENQVKAEVKTDAGYVDIVTPKQIIEVKNAKDWKGALGQVLAYSVFFENKSSRIHLFGNKNKELWTVIRDVCGRFDVMVSG
ncbi:KilA-N domain-containing protein [Desulfonema magnum]|uniref:DNA-binding domain-containing protein, KilA-N-like n=1 Tax=Desulfonema magnum TaxID=45655 RepID=A0A975BJD3_9BACT|nr:KilA-N domain-containing protein [Desulfonema magnum]QTA86214.1 DNA-binding domain-containing protein, KilA-N-like [Desulfonema magnum]